MVAELGLVGAWDVTEGKGKQGIDAGAEKVLEAVKSLVSMLWSAS